MKQIDISVFDEQESDKNIQININNLELDDSNKTVKEYLFRNEDGEVLTNNIKVININIPNIKKKYNSHIELSEFEKLMLILNENNEEKLLELSNGDKVMEEYIKSVKSIKEKIMY